MMYESANVAKTRHSVRVDRCLFTNMNNSADTDTENYALSLYIQASDFHIENCLFQDNYNLGGVRVRFIGDTSANSQASYDMGAPIGRIINCEFENIAQGTVMMIVSQNDVFSSDDIPYVTLQGNVFVGNTPLDSSNVIEFSGVYCDILSNIIFNNDGGRVIALEQANLPFRYQDFTGNLIRYNIGHDHDDINEKYTMELRSNGVQFHNNVIHNPVNEYEINAVSSAEQSDTEVEIINATQNWWGTRSSFQIRNRLRDADQVLGLADVIFEPFLLSAQSFQNCKYSNGKADFVERSCDAKDCEWMISLSHNLTHVVLIVRFLNVSNSDT